MIVVDRWCFMPELSEQGVRVIPEGAMSLFYPRGKVLSFVDPVPEVSGKFT